MSDLQVLIKRLDQGVPLPKYSKGGDAGADIVTRIDLTLEPGERALAPTGIAIALPKHGVSMVNTPGTMDAGFRGELQVILINLDPRESISFKRGDRIAQLVFQKVEHADFVEVEELPGSGRSDGGFGSTGLA